MRWGNFPVGIALVGGLALLGESVAVAADPAGQASASPIKNDTGKRVCKVLTPTGSRFTQRVCKTAEEWDHDAEMARRQREETDLTIRDNGCGFNCGR